LWPILAAPARTVHAAEAQLPSGALASPTRTHGPVQAFSEIGNLEIARRFAHLSCAVNRIVGPLLDVSRETIYGLKCNIRSNRSVR
jgi:hypothetical protein